MRLDKKEKAEALVERYLPTYGSRAKTAAKHALKLDPLNIGAIFLLARETTDPMERLTVAKEGINAAKKLLGRAVQLDEQKQGIPDNLNTSFYLNLLHLYASTLAELGRLPEAIVEGRHILMLAPHDGLGVRLELLHWLAASAAQGNSSAFQQADALIQSIDGDDPDISTPWTYGKALYYFVKASKASEQSRAGLRRQAVGILKQAISRNVHVFRYLIGVVPLPTFPSSYNDEARDGAAEYTRFALQFWRNIPKALTWLQRHAEKPLLQHVNSGEFKDPHPLGLPKGGPLERHLLSLHGRNYDRLVDIYKDMDTAYECHHSYTHDELRNICDDLQHSLKGLWNIMYWLKEAYPPKNTPET